MSSNLHKITNYSVQALVEKSLGRPLKRQYGSPHILLPDRTMKWSHELFQLHTSHSSFVPHEFQPTSRTLWTNWGLQYVCATSTFWTNFQDSWNSVWKPPHSNIFKFPVTKNTTEVTTWTFEEELTHVPGLKISAW